MRRPILKIQSMKIENCSDDGRPTDDAGCRE